MFNQFTLKKKNRKSTNKIIFVRHGSTDWNKEMLWKGPQDLHLNKQGQAEAVVVAKRLAKMPELKQPHFYVSSALNRTQDTGFIVLKELQERQELSVFPGFNERHMGDWSQCADKAREIIALAPNTKSFYQDIKEKIEAILPEDAETMDEFEERVSIATNLILSRTHELGIPIIVAHGVVLMAIAKTLGVKLQRPNTYDDAILFSRSDEHAAWQANHVSVLQSAKQESTNDIHAARSPKVRTS